MIVFVASAVHGSKGVILMTKDGFAKIIALSLLFWLVIVRIKNAFKLTRIMALVILCLMAVCSWAYLIWVTK
jgi:hypothetical protein